MRINRYLARCGYGARRNVEEFITSGRISVNGQVVTDFSTRINPEDEVKFDDMLVKPILKDQVLILNKPVGYLCSHMDVHHEKTVLNLLPEHFRRLNIAGRLDLNSRGLMIFSSDGDFIYKLTHPSYHVEKEYRLKISPCPEESFLVSTFLRGVEEGGDFLRAKKVVIENVEEGIVLVTLQEGKKRQLHRMFEVIGSDVLDLQRIRIGNLKLEDLDLKEGEYKEVSKEEILSY
ncbi:MAG: rRNA pseudouridine synthase [Leptospiraceae bacterium]|nr:rRNA pseudouridine synthase [Leptospiraceae bacterium]